MTKVKCNLEALKKAIDELGGAQKFAQKIGVSYQTVLNWKALRTSISPQNCVKIENETRGKIRREELLPDFPWGDVR